LAISLRTSGEPAYWFALLASASLVGGYVADLLAPRLPTTLREEAVVIACVSGAAIGALLAFEVFGLPLLTVYALVAGGGATELGRLAFQSLMQRNAPEGALGRVFVRYEAAFQIAWVAGALVPTLLPISFREGILILALFYVAIAGAYVVYTRRTERSGDQPP
jgi:uncharacterized membrane-anchored protein